jgi:hypothetical protein
MANVQRIWADDRERDSLVSYAGLTFCSSDTCPINIAATEAKNVDTSVMVIIPGIDPRSPPSATSRQSIPGVDSVSLSKTHSDMKNRLRCED